MRSKFFALFTVVIMLSMVLVSCQPAATPAAAPAATPQTIVQTVVVQQPGQNVVDGVLAGPPQAETGERHADLGYGQQAAGIGQKIERRLGAGIALGGHLAEARMAHRK